ncbi:MAG: tRNA pseudouridine(55) synthase TruB, partial [Pseudohongiellaceae bacterium]
MAKRRRGRDISGIILLDKPQGETSNKSLQKVKGLLKAAKAGHTGSLDPLATGVLPLCFGEATKVSQFLLESDKVYRTRIRFGIKTDSGDSEGNIISTCDAVSLKRQQVAAALEQFRGEIKQVPSMYSALKHQGQPLYKLAREGKTVPREARTVSVYDIRLLEFTEQEAEIEVHCSKGTYIRTIADDLGDSLGTGAHVVALRRLQAGPFRESDCVSYATLQDSYQEGGF